MSENLQISAQEKMVIYAARQLKPFDSKQALIGIGLPVLASQVAKHLWCSGLKSIIENWSFDAIIAEIPFSLFGGRISYGCSAQLDNGFALSGPKRGRVEIGFLGAAQVDKYGNINTTQIGPIDNPKFRIAGSGGAVDIGCYCAHTFIVCAQSKRTFVNQVDYVTTPGWVAPDNTKGERPWVPRETLGLTGGPAAIITNLGIMKFDEKTKEAYLDEYYPGVTIEQILDNTGFNLDVSRAREADWITGEELTVLRTKVDPLNVYKTR